ncbi:uncharacterized protein LOC115454186 [Manduca sexta]|uniref:uncharacterized protein LOC115454186 n=1 Tax=Manduca sexta TaxID=7130 RepID=UPI0011833599|nr:uncharacterized protein LOC115454186 [Manduca sexta]
MNKSSSNDTFISKIETKDSITLYIKLLWKQNENDLFHIKVFDGTTSWSGRYSYIFAKKFIEHICLDDAETEDQYYENVKKALRRQTTDFIYEFNEIDSNSFKFTWKKKVNNALFKYGSVPVHRDENQESKDSLIDFLLQENGDLRRSIAQYKSKNEELNNDLQKCKNELERFVSIKTSLEETLYGKFVQLLNAKKKRIQLLEESLQKFENMTESPMDTELD